MGLNPNRIARETGLPKQTVVDYAKGMTQSMSGEREATISAFYGFSVDAIFGSLDPESREVAHVTAWRERAGVSVEELAIKVNTTVAIIELIEAGELPLTGKRKLAIADALGITPGFLGLDPSAAENGLMIAAGDVPKNRRGEAARILQALRPTGTGN